MSSCEVDEYYRLLFLGSRLYEEYAKAAGTRLPTLLLMRLLAGREEGICQRDICAYLSAHKQTVSRIFDDLERRGLVGHATSERDGREKLYRLTPKGEQSADVAISRLSAIEDECLAAVGKEAIKAMNETTRRYLEQFELRISAVKEERKPK